MSRLIIEGGHRLTGTVEVSGNKNAALKLLPACMLTEESVTLHNIPEIDDVHTINAILQDLGVDIERLGKGTYRVTASNIRKTSVNAKLAGRIRASFVFSGPMLARMGTITLPGPGGDVIGGRPLDTNVLGLEALGAKVDLDEQGTFHISAP